MSSFVICCPVAVDVSRLKLFESWEVRADSRPLLPSSYAAWKSASKRNHAELDASLDLDIGNPVELGDEYRALRELLPQLNILGGRCGTDDRHVEAICAACHNIAPRNEA